MFILCPFLFIVLSRIGQFADIIKFSTVDNPLIFCLIHEWREHSEKYGLLSIERKSDRNDHFSLQRKSKETVYANTLEILFLREPNLLNVHMKAHDRVKRMILYAFLALL